MKKILFYGIFILQIIVGQAQTISVSSFKLLDTDLTANTAGTMEQDQNGEVAALIKVVTTQTGFSFDCGTMGIVKTLQKPSEIWVYVPRGVKKMTISHPQLGLLRDYFFPTLIDAARTYEMVLVSGSVRTIVEQTSRSQYLVLKVTPSNAIVELDNEILPTSNGIAQKFVKLGTYEYRVQAPDYHTAAGKVEVNDPNNKKVVDINLDPAFGWIEIPSHQEYNDAQVYIDNALVGTIPMKSKNLSSGEHSVKIVKALYNPYLQAVVVKDNETTQVTPNLSANFSEVTVTVDNNAEIYINDEKKGTGSWTGKLASGTYLLEAKKESHRSTSKSVEITPRGSQNIKLTTPTPIYGEVNLTSTPAMAEVYIDGVKMGETPLYLPHVLIGKHSVTVKHEGFSNYEGTLEIKEGQSVSISAELKDFVSANVTSEFPEALIYIDGKLVGKGKVSTTLAFGKHIIEAKINSRYYREEIYLDNTQYDTNRPFNKHILFKDEEQEITFTFDGINSGNISISIDNGKFFKLNKKRTWFARRLAFGNHTVVIKNGSKKIQKTIIVDEYHYNYTFKIE